VRDDNTLLSIDLTNPDIYFENHLVLPKDTLHVVRTVFLLRAAAYQRFAIRNYGEEPADLRLTTLFDGDFADLFEVRGLKRKRRGKLAREAARPATARLLYKGLDGELRRTDVSFSPAPRELSETSATYQIQLASGQATTIDLAIACGMPQPPLPIAPLRAMRAVYRNRRADSRNVATVETSNDLFNEMLCRSMSDLYMLISNTPQGRYPYAGIPWYSTTFGRDGLMQLMDAARQNLFTVVIVEALDRLSRDMEDLAGIHKRLSFQGIEIQAVHDGTADSILIGIRGLVGQMQREDGAKKVRRGMAGVVRDGRHAGGRAYGYRAVPSKPGELEIVEDEAAIVRRIFAAYAAGRTPRDIAHDLNRENIRPPRGRRWNASTA